MDGVWVIKTKGEDHLYFLFCHGVHHATLSSENLGIQVELNNESLKNALVYFLAECDLPFTIVERKSFRSLVHLLNEGAMPLINNTSQSGISTHLARVFLQSQETIKLNHLAKQKTLCFTTNAWTAPNMLSLIHI